MLSTQLHLRHWAPLSPKKSEVGREQKEGRRNTGPRGLHCEQAETPQTHQVSQVPRTGEDGPGGGQPCCRRGQHSRLERVL